MKKLFQSLLLSISLTAVSRADTVYVASFYGGYMNAYTSNGSGTRFADNLSAPEQTCFDRAGNLYQANYGQSRIMYFTTNGTPFVFVTTPGGADGVAVAPDGFVYVADYDGGTIYKCNPYPDGTNSVVFASGLTHPVALAFDGSTNLFVTSDSGSVAKYAPDGSFLGSATNLNEPAGLAIDRSGNLYVADFGAGTIAKYSSDGTFVGNFATGLNNPYMLAFDSKTNLFVSVYGNNTVEKFTPAGVGSTFITLTNPSSVAVWPGLPAVYVPPVVTNQPPVITNTPPPTETNTPPSGGMQFTNRFHRLRNFAMFTNLPAWIRSPALSNFFNSTNRFQGRVATRRRR